MTFFTPRDWTTRQRPTDDEIPKDDALPRLREVLNEAAMQQILQQRLPGGFADGDLMIGQCRLVFVRYKPMRYCQVFYDIDVNSKSGMSLRHIVGAKLFAKKLGDGYVRRRTKSMQPIPHASVSYVKVSDYNMLLVFFPNDLRLHRLQELLRPMCPEPATWSTLAGSTKSVENILAVEPIEIASYRPERYCLVRCEAKPSDSRPPLSVFCRMHHSQESGMQLHRVMAALWVARRQGSPLSVAQPLGYDATRNIVIQRAVGGTTLTTLADRPGFLSHIETTARNLAAIHKTRPPALGVFDTDEHLRAMQSMANAVQRIQPQAGEKFLEVLTLLRAKAPRDRDLALIHGDFSPNQVLVERQSAAVIDFDSARIGDVHRDLGNFAVRVRSLLGAPRGTQAVDTFCRAYAAARPGVFDQRRLRWHQAQGSVREAFTALKKIKPNWPALLDQHLDRAIDSLRN